MGLEGKTPADACGIEVKGDNKWLTLIQNASLSTDFLQPMDQPILHRLINQPDQPITTQNPIFSASRKPKGNSLTKRVNQPKR
jgi:hypothetical protein